MNKLYNSVTLSIGIYKIQCVPYKPITESMPFQSTLSLIYLARPVNPICL